MARWLIVAMLLVCSAGAAVLAQRELDRRKPAEGFQELMYLPEGKYLRIIAFGFDAPMADGVYLKALLYFSDNMRAKLVSERSAQHKYLYKAFNVVTDLSPNFKSSYYYGGLLLSATGKAESALDLLDRGVQRFPDDWRFPIHAAVVCEQQLKDLKRARHYVEKAARAPDVPPVYLRAVEGLVGEGDTDTAPESRRRHLLEYWRAILDDESQPKQLRTVAEDRFSTLYTEQVESDLTVVVRQFMGFAKRLPKGPGELVQTGFLREIPRLPLPDDGLVLLPDGQCRSKVLVMRETEATRKSLENLVQTHKRKKGTLPARLDELVDPLSGHELPAHPLAQLGYTYRYDPATGSVISVAPAR